MIKPVTTNIDGREYTFMPLMARAARDMLTQLVQKFGPVLGNSVKSLNGAKIDETVLEKEVLEMLPQISGGFGEMIIRFSDALSPGFYANLTDTFLKQVTVRDGENNPKLDSNYREVYFGTSLLLEAKILAWCLTEQYSDFFGLWSQIATFAASQMRTKTLLNSESQKA